MSGDYWTATSATEYDETSTAVTTGSWYFPQVSDGISVNPDVVSELRWRRRAPRAKQYELGLRTMPMVERKQKPAHFLRGMR